MGKKQRKSKKQDKPGMGLLGPIEVEPIVLHYMESGEWWCFYIAGQNSLIEEIEHTYYMDGNNRDFHMIIDIRGFAYCFAKKAHMTSKQLSELFLAYGVSTDVAVPEILERNEMMALIPD